MVVELLQHRIVLATSIHKRSEPKPWVVPPLPAGNHFTGGTSW
jgi:hypothetical protein